MTDIKEFMQKITIVNHTVVLSDFGSIGSTDCYSVRRSAAREGLSGCDFR